MTLLPAQIRSYGPRKGRGRIHALGIVLAGSALWVAAASVVQAGDPAGAIVGKVSLKDGTEVAGATVSAKLLAGGAGSSGATDRNGAFRIESLGPGRYAIEVRCPKCGEGASKQAEIKGDETVEVNFVIGATSKEQPPSGASLGPVRLDTGSPFQEGQLKDPSAGGGYSNSATVQADALYHQYLSKPPLPIPEKPALGLQESGAAGSEEAAVERRGKEFLANGKYQEAILEFQKGVDQFPRSEVIQEGLGVSFFSAGKYPEAGRAFVRAAQLAPDDPRLVVVLSEAAVFAPDPSAAAVLKQFVEAHPQSAPGHYALGYYEWKEFLAGHNPTAFNSARAQFENAIALEPTHAPARLYLGMTDDELGKTREAIENYKAAIEADPLLATAHYRLARDYQRLGEKAKAAEEFSQFQKLTSVTPP